MRLINRNAESLLRRLPHCLVLAALLLLTPSASAQDAQKEKGDDGKPRAEQEEPKSADEDQPDRENEQAQPRRGRRERRPLFDKRNERQDVSVRSAFREVVSQAARSTVEVYSGGKQVALGVVVDPDGYVATKASELGDGELSCRLVGAKPVKAQLLEVDGDTDLALLKIEAEGLEAITWNEAEAPPVGSWLATTGVDPIPVAIGVVSVAPRKIAQPGGMLGVVLDQSDDGPFVNQVLAESGAEKAGVHVNDVISHINGKQVRNVQALINTLKGMKAGRTVALTVVRGEKKLQLEATLTSRSSMQDELGSTLSERRGGFDSAIQHDTVLQANQCGGPIVDLSGKAVGLNIARAGRVVSYALTAEVVLPAIDAMQSGKAPAVLASNPRLSELERRLNELKTSEQSLLGRVTQLRDVLTKALAGLESARKNAEQDADAVKKAESNAAKAEKAVLSIEAELAAARAEITKLTQEKTSLSASRGDQ
ncbi:MAG: S1C family serine protease [Pirellulaceae bacterium]